MSSSNNRSWVRRGWGGGAFVALLALGSLGAAGCHGCRGHGPMDEAELRERAHDVAELALDHVDATPEQQTRVEESLDRWVPDMIALRPERDALAQELHDALAAEQIDPARVEAVRQKALALADRASARAAQALLETAQVLDANQRGKLLEHWRRHRN